MRKEEIRRIVARPQLAGDAVMCEPALTQVRTLFPQADITLLVKPACADLLAHHPAVTRTLVYDDRAARGLTGSGPWLACCAGIGLISPSCSRMRLKRH